jgi:hypothetical protein
MTPNICERGEDHIHPTSRNEPVESGFYSIFTRNRNGASISLINEETSPRNLIEILLSREILPHRT